MCISRMNHSTNAKGTGRNVRRKIPTVNRILFPLERLLPKYLTAPEILR